MSALCQNADFPPRARTVQCDAPSSQPWRTPVLSAIAVTQSPSKATLLAFSYRCTGVTISIYRLAALLASAPTVRFACPSQPYLPIKPEYACFCLESLYP